MLDLAGRAAVVLAASVVLLGAGRDANGDSSVRVMSFNVRYGSAKDGDNAWPKRRKAVVDTIRRFDPDLLGLQEAEAFQLDFLATEMRAFVVLGVGRDDGKRRGEFAALLIRRERFKVRQSGTRWLSDTPDTPGSISWQASLPRVFTWARLEDQGSGRELYVNNTHWDHQSQVSREKSAHAILNHLAQHAGDQVPAIVMGDLNAAPDNPAMRRIIGPDSGLTDTFHAANPNSKRIGTFNGFRGNTQGKQIDWVFTSAHWRVASAGVSIDPVDGRYPSDHFPVWAIVSLSNE